MATRCPSEQLLGFDPTDKLDCTYSLERPSWQATTRTFSANPLVKLGMPCKKRVSPLVTWSPCSRCTLCRKTQSAEMHPETSLSTSLREANSDTGATQGFKGVTSVRVTSARAPPISWKFWSYNGQTIPCNPCRREPLGDRSSFWGSMFKGSNSDGWSKPLTGRNPWLWLKKPGPKWIPGKWNQRLKPA